MLPIHHGSLLPFSHRVFPLVLALILGVYLGGCVSLYHPNAVQGPLFRNAGEVHGGVHVGFNGFDAQVAYSPVSSLALLAAAEYNVELLTLNEHNMRRHRYGELAVGYYAHRTDGLRFEMFAGAGFGNAFDTPEGDVFDRADQNKARYQRYFAQGTIGSSGTFSSGTNRGWQREGGLALRFAYLHFNELSGNDIPRAAPDVLFIEPVIFGRVGLNGVMIESQLGYSGTTANPLFSWEQLRFTFGLHLVLGREGQRIEDGG